LRARRATLRWIESIGKWSMHDVLILALTIVYLKSSGLSKATSMPGAQYFAASVVLIMLAYGWLKRSTLASEGDGAVSTIRAAAAEAPELSPVRRFLVFLLTNAAAATLAAGITMPTIKLTQAYIWSDEHSILSAVGALHADEEHFLAGLIFLFSVVFPVLKLFYLIVVTTVGSRRPELRGRLLERLEFLGKWSMMDVLVLALIIFYVNASSFANASALPGIYFFAASVVLTMLAYGLVRKLR
jgi:paraquat-inducible protein A